MLKKELFETPKQDWLNEKFQPTPLLKNFDHLKKLSEQFGIPQEEVLLIALNCSGLSAFSIKFKRGRFDLVLPEGERIKVALTITSRPLSRFEHNGSELLFNGLPIFSASQIEEDTCTDSYWRKEKKHLTLNSNSRSSCRGCDFCGTYGLAEEDKPLLGVKEIRQKAEVLSQEKEDAFTKVEAIGVVTGCFPEEEAVVNHLLLLREVFEEYGFKGEIQYIGSQIRSPRFVERLRNSGPFSYYLTLECFQRREELMKKNKASLTLGQGRELLQMAKQLGAETSFLYIAGLDNLEAMEEGFGLFSGAVTRMPLIQTFQIYQPEQITLRHPSAQHLDYYLQTRILAELLFPGLTPDIGVNYRGLWLRQNNLFAKK